MWRDYLFPETLDQALDLLVQHRGDARLIAGGTDLVLQSRQGRCPSSVMVDISRIPGLDRIEEVEGFVQVGAMVTHGQVARSPLIRARADVLAQACGQVGGPQIRNMATLVGNVVNALPAADGAVALFALDAEAEVVGCDGRRWVPIADLYESVGVCTIDSCAEIVAALRFRPLESHQRSAFQRLSTRRSLALPIINAGVVLGIQDDRFVDARIAVGPVAPRPFRAARAESELVGEAVAEEVIAAAAELAAADARPRDSFVRGSKAYRGAMVAVLVRRALLQASGLAQEA